MRIREGKDSVADLGEIPGKAKTEKIGDKYCLTIAAGNTSAVLVFDRKFLDNVNRSTAVLAEIGNMLVSPVDPKQVLDMMDEGTPLDMNIQVMNGQIGLAPILDQYKQKNRPVLEASKQLKEGGSAQAMQGPFRNATRAALAVTDDSGNTTYNFSPRAGNEQ